MDLFAAAERLMRMSDADWKRHANPWSGWTRFAILPMLSVAIWSRDWIGAWCLVPVTLVVIWTYLNPRAFPPPESCEAWISRGVLGERVWLDRKGRALPMRHVRAAWLATGVALAGVPLLVFGLWALDPVAALAGLALSVGGKLWFMDRMVRLQDDAGDPLPSPPPQATEPGRPAR